jgi:Ankyrin repeats (many copies)
LVAAEHSDKMMVDLLLGCNADVTVTHDGCSLLRFAIYNQWNTFAQVLLLRGSPLMSGDGSRLHVALTCYGGHPGSPIGSTLETWAAETGVNVRNRSGDTVLHVAAVHGGISIAKILINLGFDVNALNNQGETPLHISQLYFRVDQQTKTNRTLLLLEN